MVKTIIIGAYICHKIYWKRTNKIKLIAFDKFMVKAK